MNIFRKPFPMTDEQIIREALKTVTSYEACHPGDSFNTNSCIEQTMSSVKTIWRSARFYAPHQALKREDLEEINEIYGRIGTNLRTRAEAKVMECLKRRRVREIDIATAEALIAAELRKRGHQFFFTWQKLRVKVSVRLDAGHAMTFIVKFKEIREGKLDGIIEGVMSVVDAIGKSGRDLYVWSLSGSWRNVTCWQK